MTTSERIDLLYDPLKWDFIAFKMNISSRSKRNVDPDVAYDVLCTRKTFFTRVIIQFYDTTLGYLLNNSDVR